MSTQRHGDWLQTYTGRQFWPLDPRANEVCIEDIAHSLSLQCRFAGHCREFYSVAEHSVRVSVLVQEQFLRGERGTYGQHPSAEELAAHLALMGLLHDASEAYLVDVPRPVKRFLRGYSMVEDVCMEAICERFGLRWENNQEAWQWVKDADNTLLATEARDLMAAPPAPWEALPKPIGNRIEPWPSGHAKAMFMMRFNELQAAR